MTELARTWDIWSQHKYYCRKHWEQEDEENKWHAARHLLKGAYHEMSSKRYIPSDK